MEADKKALREWQAMWAHVYAFASDDVRRLFETFYDDDNDVVRKQIQDQIASELQDKRRPARP